MTSNCSPNGANSRPRLAVFPPDEASEPASPTERAVNGPFLWDALRARIENLRLRKDSESFSAENFTNLEKCLLRFGHAWYVRLGGGRAFLIPPHASRKVPLQIGAADEAAAAELAWKLAGLEGAPQFESIAVNGERPIDECCNDDLTRWLIGNPQWQSGHTKKNNLVAIVEALRWFEDEHDVKSPYKRKRIPKFVRKSRREATDQEYIVLMRKGGKQLRRVLWTHYNLVGIRPGEVRGMLWSDFDWDGGFVLTYIHKTARATNKPRMFTFTPRQLRFFRNLFKQRPAGTDHVFLNTEGEPWNRRALGQHLRRLAKRCGLDAAVAQKVSLGCFRQTFATQSDEAGLSEQDTAMLLGHEGTKMLRTVYSKASRKVKHVRNATERAERLRREARRLAARNKKAKRAGEIQGELF